LFGSRVGFSPWCLRQLDNRLAALLGSELGFLLGVYGSLAVGLLCLFGIRIGFSSWGASQLGSRLVMVSGFGFLGDQMGFIVGPLVGVEVG
jgi:hypothetical protein